MNLFLWAIVVVFAIDCIGKIGFLYNQETQRSLGLVAFDLLANIILLVWAACLLARASV